MSAHPAHAPTPFERHLIDPPFAGELPGADWIGEAGSLGQGEVIRLYARADGDRMTAVRFMAFGCAATLTAASVLAELLQQVTLAEAQRIGPGEIAAALGDLRQDQAHGAHLAHQALLGLLADSRGEILPLTDSMLVCSCFRVSEATLRDIIGQRQLRTLEQVTVATMAGKGCGSCHSEIRILIASLTAPRGPKPAFVPPAASGTLSMQQKASRILDQLDILRPVLQANGADALLTDLEGDVVFVRFLGATAPDGHTPLPAWLETQLRTMLWPEIVVEVAP
ncbi:MAG: iron-sulfur cluster assembly scaffold protein [Candidatus Sericytochromatia bacterium]|nr:iron-sulfur cluster assembly scaffold protein [Candidatus Sericytochromatia bacterium]